MQYAPYFDLTKSINPNFSFYFKKLNIYQVFLYSLTEHFLKLAMQELNSGKLRQEQVLLDKLRPLENRLLPLAADALLAGVDPVSIN